MSSPPSILITAVGALIGQGILRSLRPVAGKHRLIGIDRRHNAYGASLCDASYQKPCVESDPAYLPWLRGVVESENVGLILPGIEEDVFFFHDHQSAMQDWPVRVAVNSATAIAAGRDKWIQHETLLDHGLPVIPSTLPADWSQLCAAIGEPPFIAKARRGSGSRGQRVIRTEADWQKHRHECENGFMVQRIVGSDDDEHTVGLFGYGDGTSSTVLILRRRLWNGMTWQAEVVEADDSLAALCSSLTRLFKPLGPTNYQFRRDGSQWLLLEINPRISSATAMRAGFGFNDARLCVEHWLHGVERPQPGALRRGRCQRFVQEHFEFA